MNKKRILIFVFILIAAFLVLRKSPMYAKALSGFVAWFRKAWLALTRGKAPEV